MLDEAESVLSLVRPIDAYSYYLNPGQEFGQWFLLIAHIDDDQFLYQTLDCGSDILQSKRREEVIVR